MENRFDGKKRELLLLRFDKIFIAYQENEVCVFFLGNNISFSQEERITALQENRYLSGLDNSILDFLTKNTQLLSFEADEVIFREGQPCLGLYIIKSGRVKIFKYSASGREMIINVSESGDSFNEVPVFGNKVNFVSPGTGCMM